MKDRGQKPVGKAIYYGEEFPLYKGWMCVVYDDNSDPKNPCYLIDFADGFTADNIDDDDLVFVEK